MNNVSSPRVDDEGIEPAIAAVSTAPRVTPADLDAVIVRSEFHRLSETLTVCVLTLHNGFTVTGESACASPENYNREIGERIAFTNAREKLWPLLGYALKDRLFREHAAPVAIGEQS